MLWIGIIILMLLVGGSILYINLDKKETLKPIEGTSCEITTECYDRYRISFTSCSCSWTLVPSCIPSCPDCNDCGGSLPDCDRLCSEPIEAEPKDMKCVDNVCNIVMVGGKK